MAALRHPRALALAGICGFCFSALYVFGALKQPELSGLLIAANAGAVFAAMFGGVYALRGLSWVRGGREIAPSGEYGWSLGRTITLGVVAFAGLALASVLLGVIVGINVAVVMEGRTGVVDEMVIVQAVAQSAGLFLTVGYYFIGRWIGYRCREKVPLAVVLVVVLVLGAVFVINTSSVGFHRLGRS